MPDREEPREIGRQRRIPRGTLWGGVAACTVLAAGLIPSPYVIERPGPTVDVLGSVTLGNEPERPVIEVDGAGPYSGEGSLRLVTVSIAGSREHPNSWLSLLPGLIDPTQDIQPVEVIFPEGVTEHTRTEQNAELMESSQELAAAAAFTYLGERVPVTLSVAGVAEGSPAEGVLQDGDVLLEVEHVSDFDFAQLRESIVNNGIGEPLELMVQRDGSPVEVEVTPQLPDGGSEPMIGAVLHSDYELPREVDIALSDIGGPSAGLIFALGLLEQLEPDSVLAGLDVAGTGTIDAAGRVGAIGGLAQKMQAAKRAGSELFLMPAENCADAPDEFPEGLRVVPVGSLDEAVAAIEAVGEGRAPSIPEGCRAR